MVPSLTPTNEETTSSHTATQTSARVANSAHNSHTSAVAPNATGSHKPQNRPESGGGLSTGATIGVGIAISVFMIGLLCALGFYCYRRHKQKKKRVAGHGQSTEASGNDKEGKSRYAEKNTHGKPERGVDGMPYELSGSSRAGELETNANRHELDAYRRGQGRHELPGEVGENILLDASQKPSSKD